MNLARPESMYFALSSGQVVSWNAAQWVQVIEAYSMIVAGAFADPCTMSGSGPTDINCSSGTITGAAARPGEGGAKAGVGEAEGCGAAGASALWRMSGLEPA